LFCFQLWYERFIAADHVAPPESVARRWSIPVRAGARAAH
jgi:hypothetical protein